MFILLEQYSSPDWLKLGLVDRAVTFQMIRTAVELWLSLKLVVLGGALVVH